MAASLAGSGGFWRSARMMHGSVPPRATGAAEPHILGRHQAPCGAGDAAGPPFPSPSAPSVTVQRLRS